MPRALAIIILAAALTGCSGMTLRQRIEHDRALRTYYESDFYRGSLPAGFVRVR